MVDPNADTRIASADETWGLVLEVVDGPAAGQTATMGVDGSITVGRGKDADLRITSDRAISRHHFAIEGKAATFRLVDMGSANGTLLDGARVDGSAPLQEGALITAGHCDFLVRIYLPKARPRPRPNRPSGSVERRRLRCTICDRQVTIERATVLVDDEGHILSQPTLADEYVCSACRDVEENEVHFPGYRTVAEIGEGNMGAIYLVRPEGADRTYVLKCLRNDNQLSDTAVGRFLREAAALSQLRHPNIVGFVDQGYVDGEFFFVMDYVEGVDLDLYRRQAGGRVAPGRCVDLIGQILDGLDYAHRQGFVHRDVKPANILVGVDSGRMMAKLTDFGLAKRYRDAGDPITRGHISFGTPDYMPPEQITNFKDIGPRSDVYATGATLYHLLSGVTLYEGAAGADPIRTLLENDPQPLTERAPWLPPAVAEVVDRAIERAPDDRWNSAGAFRDALAQAWALS